MGFPSNRAFAVVNSLAETRAVQEFFAASNSHPSVLLMQGEPGIGKTTQWLAALDQARESGYRVLSAHAAAAESVLAYAALADLLNGVEANTLSTLPRPQRIALDQMLLRAEADVEATDPRAVAAGFLSVVTALAEGTPVLLAIDDLQWLDQSSAAAIAFAVRRLSGPVGVLATLRTNPDSTADASWLQLSPPDTTTRITLGPLSLGALRTVVSARLGRSIPRRVMVRICDMSGGNPFYALELARAMADTATGDDISIPSTLSELVHTRIGGLDSAARGALLAMACAAAPTVELIARATDTPVAHVVDLLAGAEAEGIIGYDGQRLRFGHPLLAAGVYADASPSKRRAMHRQLAGIVTEPELQARHLALAVTTADQPTLEVLDAAAVSATLRGAPGAAAELLDMAIELGGDTSERRIRAAEHHLRAANFGEATTRLQRVIENSGPGEARAGALTLLAEVRCSEENFDELALVSQRVLAESAGDLERQTRALTLSSFALGNVLRMDEATRNIDDAVELATQLGQAELLSPALAFRTMLRFGGGHGFDEPTMVRALELELELKDAAAKIPLAVRASAQNGLLLAWTGELARGYDAMGAVRQSALDRGEEHELATIDFHCMWIAIWRGDLAHAALLAEDALDRARMLDSPHPLFAALTMRATVAAHAGQERDARDAVADAMDCAERFGAPPTTRWAIATLGFLEVSLGNYSAALDTLGPLLAMIDVAPVALEMLVAMFVPDAAEALVAANRLDEADHLLDRFERDGRRLDRTWILACGGRARAMLLAARGDVDAAGIAARQAMTEHDRLPMPFERARTQLLLGQLERRQRRNRTAETNLRAALDTFEQLGTPLWASRARAELQRANVGPHPTTTLTSSEQRVAELAASGMTNRDVAAALFISPKTVESNLARIYRKLGIRSRAELGTRINRLKP